MSAVIFYSEWIFWISLLLLLHCYIVFPLTLPFISEFFKRKHKSFSGSYEPKVSILISAFNEEGIIEKKILNTLELDYPKDSLEILIGDDGSSDSTAEIVLKYKDRGVRLVKAEKNAGKASMLNRLQKEAQGEILLFCDANTLFFPNVVRKIVMPFQDPKVGCSCGHLILSDYSGSLLGQGESSYWDLESEIKRFEGVLDLLIGGNGALYAIRSNLYTTLPIKKSVMDDFFITVKILQKGFYCTFVSTAIGTEQTSKESIGEFRRKVRIGRANFNFLFSYLPLLNPLRPLLAYLFFSHKLLRWFTPHLGIVLLLSNATLLFSKEPIYVGSFVFFILLLLMGVLRLIPSAYYFLSMNMAILKGFFLSFTREKSGGWKRETRTDDETVSTSIKTLPFLALLMLALSAAAPNADALITLDLQAGILAPAPKPNSIHINLGGHVWFPVDQMVFLGVGGSYQEIANSVFVPVTASLWVRLPVGGQILPVVTGDFGYAIGKEHQFVWNAGLGMDIKNGNYSSLILLVGYQRLKEKGSYLYWRAGILIEI
ncbi:MAG TPA: glycosyltransferase family 2 protein [Fibrobacter sp.]|nr:glycosyltransferase family 2 protein [Fibrobacter sp.]